MSRWGRRAFAVTAAVALAGMGASCGGDNAEAGTDDPLTITTAPRGGGVAGAVGSMPVATDPVATQPPDTEPTTTAAPPASDAPPAPAPKPAAPGPAPARPVGGGTAACPNVEIVSARGTTEPQSGSFILGGLNRGIAGQVPNTPTYQVVYPASADFVSSPPVGTRDALAHLRAKVGQCANTRFFLTGYSQGAMVVTQVLQQAGDLAPRIIGGVLYGNPYYKGSSPSAAGPDKAAGGLVPGAGIPASWAGKVRDYCVGGDTVCGSRTAGGGHLSYPGAVQADAIGWAVGHIRSS